MKLIAVTVVILAVVACSESGSRNSVDLHDPALRTRMAKDTIPSSGMYLTTVVAEFDAQQTAAAMPEPTNIAPWKRPGAEATLAAACPEEAWAKEWVTHFRRWDTNELMAAYPHGLIRCTVPYFSDNVPGFEFVYVTPIPKGVYFSDQVPTPTPIPD